MADCGRWHCYTFRYILLTENICILIEISLKFIFQGPVNNLSTLVKVMVWRYTQDKPLALLIVCLLISIIKFSNRECRVWVSNACFTLWCWQLCVLFQTVAETFLVTQCPLVQQLSLFVDIYFCNGLLLAWKPLPKPTTTIVNLTPSNKFECIWIKIQAFSCQKCLCKCSMVSLCGHGHAGIS